MTTFKLEMEATIGYDNYSNIKPKITLEGGDMQEMINMGLQGVAQVSKQVENAAVINVKAMPEKGTPKQFKEVKRNLITSAITGTQVFYDHADHRYEDIDGNPYESSSKFPGKFFSDFDREGILKKLVEKYPTLKSKDIDDMWKLSAEMSTSYGSSVHAVLENWFKNRTIGEVMRNGDDKVPNKALSRNPFLKHLADTFIEVFPYDKYEVLSEEFISNDEFKQCGRMDMFIIIDKDKKVCRLADYKTDTDVDETKYQKKDSPFKPISVADRKKGAAETHNSVPNTQLGLHSLQLSHQKFILERAGWTVQDTGDIFWLNPNKIVTGENPWERREVKLVDVSQAIIGV